MAFVLEFCRFFGSLGNGFSGFSSLENMLENKTIFNEKTDPETLNWVVIYPVFGPSTDIKALPDS